MVCFAELETDGNSSPLQTFCSFGQKCKIWWVRVQMQCLFCNTYKQLNCVVIWWCDPHVIHGCLSPSRHSIYVSGYIKCKKISTAIRRASWAAWVGSSQLLDKFHIYFSTNTQCLDLYLLRNWLQCFEMSFPIPSLWWTLMLLVVEAISSV